MVDFGLIMNSPVKDLAINVVCNVLTDIVYWGYHKARELKNKKNQEIQEVSTRLKNLLNKYTDTAVDSGSFSEFLLLPQVNNAIKHCCNSIRGIDKNIIKEFFNEFFDLSRKYYYDNLSLSEKTIVFFINDRLDKLEKIILNNIQYNVEIIPDFDKFAEEYKRIIKRNNNMCLVYGFAEVKINQCYVLPDLIGNASTERFEIEDNITKHKIEIPTIKEITWNNIFQNDNIVYLIGGAGYGKSLYLQYLINFYEQLNVKNINEFIVLYCDLKTYYNNSDKQPYSIVEFLADSAIESTGLEKDKINPDFIKYFLNTGRCLILFDALDEVPKQQRSKLHSLITSFFIENNQNNKVCITSRARGFFPKHEIEVYEIAELTRSQIITYLDKMVSLKFFKKEDIPLFLQQADDLQNKNFLNSFLLLSLLVNIFKAEKKLPQTKVDLYRKCFDYMAKDREMTKSEFDKKYDWNKISHLMKDSTFIELACLAAPNNANIKENQIVDRLSSLYEKRFGCYAEAEDAVVKFLSFCSERTELFVPAAEDKTYKFFHRSFFEYFYARYIFTNLITASKIYKEFLKFDIDTEIYELTVSLIKNDKEILYQNLVEYIFKRTEETLLKGKNAIKDINILVSILQTVDETFYKIRFSKLFLEYSEILCNPHLYIRDEIALKNIIDEALNADKCLLDLYYNKNKFKLFSHLIYRLTVILGYNDHIIVDRFFNEKQRPFVIPFNREIIPIQTIIYHTSFVKEFFEYVKKLDNDMLSNEAEILDKIDDASDIDSVIEFLKSKSEIEWECFLNNVQNFNWKKRKTRTQRFYNVIPKA